MVQSYNQVNCFLKRAIEPFLRAIISTCVFVFLGLINTDNAYEGVLDVSFSQQTSLVNRINTKKQAINNHKSDVSDSIFFTAKAQDGIKHKNFYSICFQIPISLTNIQLFRFSSFCACFLSRQFIKLEILSSRNHPPTFI